MTDQTRLGRSGGPIPLAEPKTRAEFQAQLRASPNLAHLADRLNALKPDADPNELIGTVLATRPKAHEFIAAHPDLSEPVKLDARYVEVVSPPFVQELLKAWPDAEFVNANEDVAETVAFVRDRMQRNG